ncbi:MAG TPA: hypothetical protein VLM40_19580, partial [Gemmata sp.]|nr:hypothetical protein [Gemmata sp.]
MVIVIIGILAAILLP